MKYFDYDAYIKQLEELVSIDSGSFDPEGVDKVAEAMARKYEELGLTVTKKRFDERAGYCLEVYRYFNGRPHGYSLPEGNSCKKTVYYGRKESLWTGC